VVVGVNVRLRHAGSTHTKARLAHNQLYAAAAARRVADPLLCPGVHPPRHDLIGRAASSTGDRFDLDPPTSQQQVDRLDHPIPEQV
jgi:hypothetical protein